MCGIVAVACFEKWGIGYKEREIFHQLIIANALRGTHGTGVMIVDDKGEHRSLKIGAGVYDLLRAKDYGEFVSPTVKGAYDPNAPRDTIIVGHNRFKTTGDASTAHAHPHRQGDIILVHNGTIPQYSNLPDFKKFEVDSAALANAIDTLGVEEAIAKTHGAYAIIYYNIKDQTLNILRNDDRPLSMAIDEKHQRIYWASEEKMLEWILHRNDLKDLDIEPVKKDTLYTYKLTELTPEKREIKGPKVTEYFRGSLSWWDAQEIDLTTKWQGLENAKNIPPEMKQKKIAGTVKKLGKLGIHIKILPELHGLKKNESIVFRVTDYAEENPVDGTFIIMGESKTLPKTSIRFRLKGEKALSELFETPEIIATIANMVEYPEGNEQHDQYVVWVKNPNAFVAKQATH